MISSAGLVHDLNPAPNPGQFPGFVSKLAPRTTVVRSFRNHVNGSDKKRKGRAKLAHHKSLLDKGRIHSADPRLKMCDPRFSISGFHAASPSSDRVDLRRHSSSYGGAFGALSIVRGAVRRQDEGAA